MSAPLTPAVVAWLDQSDALVTTNVRRYGVHITYIGAGCSRPGCTCEDSGPAFAYTTGLFGLHHPELLVFGLPPQTSMKLLNELTARVVDGGDLVPGQLVHAVELPPMFVEAVPNPGEIVFEANRFYDRPRQASVPVYQLTRSDDEHRFPWDPNCSIPLSEQPRPGTFRA